MKNSNRLPHFLNNYKVVILSGAFITALLLLVVVFEYSVFKESGWLNNRISVLLTISFLLILAAVLFVTWFNLRATRKREQEISKRLHVADTLINCITLLAEENDINKAIDNLLKILNDYFDGDRAYLFEFDYEKQTTSNSYEYAAEGVSKEINNLQDVPLSVIDSWIRKFEETGTFYISCIDTDVDKDSDTYRILDMQQIQSLIAVPLIEKDTIIGFLGIDNPKINYTDLSLLSSATFFILDSIERRESYAMLQRLSFEDTLTSVHNRNKFNNVIEELSHSFTENIGIAFFDINGLKEINDNKGHDEGDKTIKNAAACINSIFNKSTYRIGGDEFVVIAFPTEKNVFEASVDKVIKDLQNIGISTSVGTAWASLSENIEGQLSHADKLMYENKLQYYKENALQGE